ncbi:enoyl-CoA hydratase/isomerase family protein [Pseudonocardia kujensis]|uniref:enoyl-CoA hydratase/isomerase family protein n=1 Tax=Pseudonocardia kujensis TaxID=1128675 RepID=UPI001E6427BA|nr:enoyl-CoA hydratase/isomerase family protein [Pseudonocardia kujensis]MCE0764979.1 enoyl-CoA hydratase/isomerase family protein [Pseudonocardia kujensis]
MTSTLTSAVLQERRGPALWLRLNRPEVFNGLNQDVLDGLTAGLDAADADPEVRVVVLAAEGKAFCAGADLAYARSLAEAPVPPGAASAANEFLRRGRLVFDRIESFRKPVIAAVNGVTVGGGLELVLACDLAVASRTAKIGDGHAVYGQIPGGGASVRLVRRLGLATAKHLMFTGELHPAERFLGTDLLADVVEPDELVPAVDALCAVIAGRSPVGLAAMKTLANAAQDTPLPVAVTRELELSALHERSADWREGITAFAEKRTPEFPGR